jgi:GT2 family glycosyltransferase
LSAVTIIVKTFERKHSLARLLESIQQHIDHTPVLVGDDSKVPYGGKILPLFPDLDLEYDIQPHDIGVSAGRNRLLDKVEEEFFVLCDDDFVFDERTDINRSKNILLQNNYDILGGAYFNHYPVRSLIDFLSLVKNRKRIPYLLRNIEHKLTYNGFFIVEGDTLFIDLEETDGSIPKKYDIVQQFFIARTKAVKKIGGWDPNLKTGEHEDFFFRAKKNGLKVGYLPGFGVQHFPSRPLAYRQFRKRALFYKKQFMKKFEIRSYIVRKKSTGKILIELHLSDKELADHADRTLKQ